MAYDFLAVVWRTVQHSRVEMGGRRYNGPALNAYRGRRSSYSGAHAGKWSFQASTAASVTDAWTAARATAFAALLGGVLDDLAVTIDCGLEALPSHSRDLAGRLAPEAVAAGLVEIHHGATVRALVDQPLAADWGSTGSGLIRE